MPTPDLADYYHNITITHKEIKTFFACQKDPTNWAKKECVGGGCPETGRHVHMVSARYMHQWVARGDDEEEYRLELAPHIGLVLNAEKLRVRKNCVLSDIRTASANFRKDLVLAGASVETPIPAKRGEAKADPVEEEQGVFHGKAFPNAYAAGRALAKGDYSDLQTVVRFVGNNPWRKLDKIAPTASSLVKIKKDLGATYTTHILPVIQRTGGATMREVLDEINQQAAKHGTARKDCVFGYFLSRLAEPINGITTIDGKMQIVYEDIPERVKKEKEEQEAEDETPVGNWLDE